MSGKTKPENQANKLWKQSKNEEAIFIWHQPMAGQATHPSKSAIEYLNYFAFIGGLSIPISERIVDSDRDTHRK